MLAKKSRPAVRSRGSTRRVYPRLVASVVFASCVWGSTYGASAEVVPRVLRAMGSEWAKQRDLERIDRLLEVIEAPDTFGGTRPWLRFLAPWFESMRQPKLSAVRSLAAMKRPEATNALLAVIDTPGFPHRVEAIRAIARAPEIQAMRPLTGWLDDPDPAVRYVAARSLGFVGGEAAARRAIIDDAFLRLKERLTEEPDPGVRAAVVDALVMLGTTEGLVSAFEIAIRDESAGVRCAILSVAVSLARHYASLAVMAPARGLLPEVPDAAGLPETMGDAARAYAQRDFQPILSWQSGCADPALEAIARLAEVRAPEVYALLMAARRSDDAGLRRVAYTGLLHYRRPEAFEAALAGLEDPIAGVRHALIEALAEQRKQRAEPAHAALAEALADPSRAEADRRALARALERSREVEVLIASLAGGAVQTRRAAGESLATIFERHGAEVRHRAIPLLLEALSSSNPNLRTRAARALARIADAETEARLAARARRDDPGARLALELIAHARSAAEAQPESNS